MEKTFILSLVSHDRLVMPSLLWNVSHIFQWGIANHLKMLVHNEISMCNVKERSKGAASTHLQIIPTLIRHLTKRPSGDFPNRWQEWKIKKRCQELQNAIDRLYDVFGDYVSGDDFCDFCYSEDEIKSITKTPLKQINGDLTRKLLWETGEHWQNSQTYRHYLPRILEVLAPPENCDDLYPLHLFETLRFLRFEEWPKKERAIIDDFLHLLTQYRQFESAEDLTEWTSGLNMLQENSQQGR